MNPLLESNESEKPSEDEFKLNNDELALLAEVLIKKQAFAKLDTSVYDFEFSKRVKVAIRESEYHDWVQEQFAKACNVKQNTVSTWITGMRKPEVETGIEFCKLLNVSFDWLYTGRGPMRPLREATNEHERLALRLLRTRPSYLRIVMNLLDQLETQIHD
jgi:transcriptional regulator with XRE-family HTH domain